MWNTQDHIVGGRFMSTKHFSLLHLWMESFVKQASAFLNQILKDVVLFSYHNAVKIFHTLKNNLMFSRSR